jgi:hypothetical protein
LSSEKLNARKPLQDWLSGVATPDHTDKEKEVDAVISTVSS